MKTLYALAALTVFNMVSAQKTTDLKDFKSLTIGQDMNVELVKSSQNKLVVKSSDEDEEVGISNMGGHLSINGDDATIVLYYKDALENVVVGADSEIFSNDEIKTKVLVLTAGADATVKLKIDVKKLYIQADADSQINLMGKATEHFATLSSDVQMAASDLITENSTLTLASDAQASVNATGTVNATVSSDGSLKIYGNPKKVNEVKGGDSVIVVVR